jgi:hypothetical protein
MNTQDRNEERAGLKEIQTAALRAVRDIQAYLAGPPAPDEEIRSWPLWAGIDGIWCADASCPLLAENSEIGEFRVDEFTLDELHEAIGHHIAAQHARESDES